MTRSPAGPTAIIRPVAKSIHCLAPTRICLPIFNSLKRARDRRLANIFTYTFAAMPSLACSAGISALKFGLDRIATGISRGLFIEDADAHLQSLRDYDEQELDITAAASHRNFQGIIKHGEH